MNASQSPELPLHTPNFGAEPRPDPTAYAPSVPISVYRELAKELQMAQATIDALTVQNQQLTHQNQTLRQEVQRFVLAAQQLGQLTGAPTPEAATLRPGASPRGLEGPDRSAPLAPETSAGRGRGAESRREGTRPIKDDRPTRMDSAKTPAPLFTEQQEPLRHPRPGQRPAPDLTNLWLGLTIILVIFTAFGAGFLIMRPVLNR